LLTVAGFDGTSGAGIACDFKICSRLKIKNVAAVTALVLQTPLDVIKTSPVPLRLVREQIEVLNLSYDFPVVHVGLLMQPAILNFLKKRFPRARIVFDPVFFSGSGKFAFWKPAHMRNVIACLNGIYLFTPNIPEAEKLTGMTISTLAAMEKAARQLQCFGVANVLIKGGHLKRPPRGDILQTPQERRFFPAKLRPCRIHGTGSFLNAAISAYLFKGQPLIKSVALARHFLDRAAQKVRRHEPILEI